MMADCASRPHTFLLTRTANYELRYSKASCWVANDSWNFQFHGCWINAGVIASITVIFLWFIEYRFSIIFCLINFTESVFH